MPEALQESIACIIGKDYPHPLVDHAEQRKRAIARYEWAKEKRKCKRRGFIKMAALAFVNVD